MHMTHAVIFLMSICFPLLFLRHSAVKPSIRPFDLTLCRNGSSSTVFTSVFTSAFQLKSSIWCMSAGVWVLVSEGIISRFALLQYLSAYSCRGERFCVCVCVCRCKSQASAEKMMLLLWGRMVRLMTAGSGTSRRPVVRHHVLPFFSDAQNHRDNWDVEANPARFCVWGGAQLPGGFNKQPPHIWYTV